MSIIDEKLKAAIQIALGSHGIYTEKIESDLIHHIKALTIPVVVDSEAELCGKPNCNREKLQNSPLCSYHWDIANS